MHIDAVTVRRTVREVRAESGLPGWLMQTKTTSREDMGEVTIVSRTKNGTEGIMFGTLGQRLRYQRIVRLRKRRVVRLRKRWVVVRCLG